MYYRARKLKEYLEENMHGAFGNVEEPSPDFHAFHFYDVLSYGDHDLESHILVDESTIVQLEIVVAYKIVDDKNCLAVVEYINELNSKYKIGKFYADKHGSIILQAAIPTDSSCNPAFIEFVIDILSAAILEEYDGLLQKAYLRN